MLPVPGTRPHLVFLPASILAGRLIFVSTPGLRLARFPPRLLLGRRLPVGFLSQLPGVVSLRRSSFSFAGVNAGTSSVAFP